MSKNNSLTCREEPCLYVCGTCTGLPSDSLKRLRSMLNCMVLPGAFDVRSICIHFVRDGAVLAQHVAFSGCLGIYYHFGPFMWFVASLSSDVEHMSGIRFVRVSRLHA